MIKVEKLNPFGRMCISLGMLPSSYKESLTYEEQLLWFFKYLDETVIPTVNNNADAVSELQSLYNEIKTYVDDYFENLDVQEEINNKLDDMADSGELADIIAQYLGLAGVLAFDKVRDLKAAENIVNGSICKTLGYSNITDGKGAFYKIRTITSGDVVDENNIIALSVSDTLIAQKILTYNETIVYPYFDVLKNGGSADGSTPNDTIISNALTAGYKRFYFPQNSSNNAIYYFTNIPNFSNCEIRNDEGVTLSFPYFHNTPNLHSTIFHNNINKYARDNETSSHIPTNYPMLYNMLHTNYDYTKKNMRRIQWSNSDLKCYHYKYNNGFVFEVVDKATYYEHSGVEANRLSSSTNNYFNGLCFPIEDRNTIETAANGKMDFCVLNSTSLEGIYCVWNNNNLQVDIYYDSGTALTQTKINLVSHNSSNSMIPTNTGIYKIRWNKKQKIIEFYINDLIVARYIPQFEPTHFGFGRSSNSNTVKFTDFLVYQSDNVSLNATLKILIAGDSRFHNDGSTLSIDNIIKHGLLYNGINKVTIDNISVSGDNISQIYTLLQNQTLTNYDIVIVETGINNSNTSTNDIANQIYSIADLLNAAGTFNIFTSCIPTAWGGVDAASTLRSTNYYRIKNALELGVASVGGFRKFCVLLENNCGNTSDDSNLPINCDGVHPNDLGLIEIGRNIIDGINNILKD